MADHHRRSCLQCKQWLPPDSFSKYQLGEGRMAKCSNCVAGVSQAARDERQASKPSASMLLKARSQNHLSSAAMPFDNVVDSSGVLRHVAVSDRAAAKFYKDKAASLDDNHPVALGDRGLFRLELKAAQRAQRIIEEWNQERIVAFPVRLHMPIPMRVVTDTERTRREAARSAAIEAAARGGGRAHRRPGMQRFENDDPFQPAPQVLLQPRVVAMSKYNSGSGWSAAPPSGTAAPSLPEGSGTGSAPPSEPVLLEAMQALSHYSYASTGGEVLLCGLKGSGGLLSECAVHSRGQTFGPSDLGMDGIRSWFAHHRCNRLCKGMATPQDAEAIFPVQRGSQVVHSRGLPPRVLPPPRTELGPRLATDDFFVDVASVERERSEREIEAQAREGAEASRRAASARDLAKQATAAAARAEAEAAAELERLERMNGINGITGIIGRVPTTRQRPTAQELIQGRREWPRGSGKWVFEDPQGWRGLTKLEDLMKAPNDGSFYTEPAETEEQLQVEEEGEPAEAAEQASTSTS